MQPPVPQQLPGTSCSSSATSYCCPVCHGLGSYSSPGTCTSAAAVLGAMVLPRCCRWGKAALRVGLCPPPWAALQAKQSAREALTAALTKKPPLIAVCTAHDTLNSPGMPKDTGCWATCDIHRPSYNPGKGRRRIAAIRNKVPQTPRHFWQLSVGSHRPRLGHGRSLDPGNGSRGLSCLPSIRMPGSQGRRLQLLLRDDSFLAGGGTCPAQASIKTTKGILHRSSGTSGVSSLPLSRIRRSLVGSQL